MWAHKSDEDVTLSNILGRYEWIWKDASIEGAEFLEEDMGGLTIELKDASSPASLENLQGKVEYGSICCDVLAFKQYSDKRKKPVRNSWRLIMKYTGPQEYRDGDSADWIDESEDHQLSICEQSDDDGRPFVELNLDANGWLTLLGRKFTGGRAPGMTDDEERRLKKECVDNGVMYESEEEMSDSLYEPYGTLDYKTGRIVPLVPRRASKSTASDGTPEPRIDEKDLDKDSDPVPSLTSPAVNVTPIPLLSTAPGIAPSPVLPRSRAWTVAQPEEDFAASQILGQYHWVLEDQILKQTVIRQNRGGLIINLRDRTAPVTASNITGSFEYDSLKCNIKEMTKWSPGQLPTQRTWRTRWKLVLDCPGDHPELSLADDNDGTPQRHELYISTVNDKLPHSFVELVLHEQGTPHTVLVGKRYRDNRPPQFQKGDLKQLQKFRWVEQKGDRLQKLSPELRAKLEEKKMEGETEKKASASTVSSLDIAAGAAANNQVPSTKKKRKLPDDSAKRGQRKKARV
ncbi:hypothetical protein SISSUDRAFT_1045023 [Sistotremastrum suecicum HHB10207 ss-3]|uniref:Uncharacterized protein n=1 Tax=Sistotremastrum suecicum HHB10207 ss-3 TaxID=1314776 RepID=A0A166ES55_9AGAM|nr:hypothetical protein SISSUDRAFT_1045023 [Sistotremastrum suecicum HHB10207 ss-3]